MMKPIEIIKSMQNSVIKNYVLEGLTSSLIGGGNHGSVRIFEASRNQRRHVTPHSHKFDFTCLVLEGFVDNYIWYKREDGDLFVVGSITYEGKPGKFSTEKDYIAEGYGYRKTTYTEGDWYSMNYQEIHSIEFSNDAKVLFFEGPNITNISKVLLPSVDGLIVDTMIIESWMYQP